MPVSINGTTGLITAGATSSGGGGVATNTALGGDALVANTSGARHTAVGYQAGYSVSTNDAVTAVGYFAGYSNTGGFATFVGRNAGYLSTASKGTMIGDGAGSEITTGANNTIIGRYTGNQGGLDIRTASNNIVLSDGDGNPRLYYDNSTGTWTTSTNISFFNANEIANLSYNNNSLNSIVGIPYNPCIIRITITGAAYSYVQWYPNSGAGSAWVGTLFNPGNGAWTYGTGPSISFTTAGTNATSFTCSIDSSNGSFRIQRTSGSVLYNVAVYRQVGV
jgi:hypothetical protein